MRNLPGEKQTVTDSMLTIVLVMAIAIILVSQASAQSNVEKGDFEGTYVVGATSCLVTPSKMSFEVHWKEKTEPEYYFYDASRSVGASTVFSTDPGYDSGRLQSFIFDSPELNQGTFVQADGMKLKVARQY